MKLTLLLACILFFYSFKLIAQDDLKSSQNIAGNLNSIVGGCNGSSIWLRYSISPFTDSTHVNYSYYPDTIYKSVNDSVRIHVYWDSFDCGPIDHAIWYKDSIAIDTNYYTGWTLDTYRMVQQPGLYYAFLVRTFGSFMQINSPLLEIIDTNSTVYINPTSNSQFIFAIYPNPTNEKLNVTTANNELCEIILFDIASRKLLQQTFTNSTTINTEQLAKGIYLYELRNKNGVIKKGKVVKD